MRVARLLLGLSALGLVVASPGNLRGAYASSTEACGQSAPCTVPSGAYWFKLPQLSPGEEPKGTLFYLHGWKGKASKAIENPGLVATADTHGLALVVPQGLGETWSYPSSPSQHRDEFQFFDEILSDLKKRPEINLERTLVTGFSMGGSMVWYLACYRGAAFDGFAPIAGAFWDPMPQTCPSDLTFLTHIHGTKDRTVPLEGRRIGGKWHQSDVFKSLDLWKARAQLPQAPMNEDQDGRLTCNDWQQHEAYLEICLHDGGHTFRAEWVERAWQKLAAANGW
ncbi:polyhydroxybutyrate depolymerase [Pseudovibrio sp. SPO723]|uniref:alpha/beta hydrolase family esterase n=1 Tax=Nesiotobacter zosterae TaxID=392721 RepID=UPI0029C48DE2|nr:polyhydroxybutyrate depolymerase [Pseudovibrio sp. SPO723]MDX5592248.1 polyhydroxybutyrate depolymerase [Pseudovibrio sp. SPO723]